MSFETFFGSNTFNFYQLITPYKGTKRGLLIYRIVVFIIYCYGLFTSIYAYEHPNPNDTRKVYFAFFTTQTYFGIMFYFAFNIILHLRDNKGLLKSRTSSSFINTIVHIFINMMFPLAAIVTSVFCGLMLPTLQTFYYNHIHYEQQIIQHILNSVFLGIDWYLITVPTKITHFIPTFLAGICYLIFALIYHHVTDHWIYKFLNTDNSNWYLIYGGVVILWTLYGLIFSYLQSFKNRKRRYVTDVNINKMEPYTQV